MGSPARQSARGWYGDRNWHVAGLVAMCVAVVGFRIVTTADFPGPFVMFDEGGYLLGARTMSGAGVDATHPGPPFYSLGYALFLVPLFWLGLSPGAVYAGALVVNALFGGLLIALLYVAARRIFALSPWRAVLAASVAGVYPAFVMNGSMAWAENAAVPFAVGWGLLIHRLLERPSTRGALALGLASGFLFAIHPRLAVMAIISVAVLLTLVARRRLTRTAGTVGMLSVGGVILLTRILEGMIFGRLYEEAWGGGGETGVGRLLSGVITPSEWPEVMSSVVGTVWYLSVASVLLLPLGLAALVRGLSVGRPQPGSGSRWEPAALSQGIIGLSAVLCVIESALFIRGGSRIDHDIYGRYAEAAIGLPLLAGLVVFLSPPPTKTLARLFTAAGVIAVAAAVLVVGIHGPSGLEGRQLVPITILGILVPAGVDTLDFAAPALDIVRANLVAGTGAVLAVVLLLSAVPRRRPVVGAAIVGVFGIAALWSSVVGSREMLLPVARHNVAQAALRFHPVLVNADRVAYDLADYQAWGLGPYQFWLPDVGFDLFDSRSGARPPHDLVIAAVDSEAMAAHQARLVGVEIQPQQALWVLPGPLQDRLVSRGYVIDPGDDGAPARGALAAEVSLSGVPLLPTMVSAGRLGVRVKVRHVGTSEAWRHSPLPADRGRVVVMARWFDTAGTPVAHQFQPLDRNVVPGGSVSVTVGVTATRDTGAPLPPGLYAVQFSPVVEHVGEFSELGGRGRAELLIRVK